MDKPLTTEPMGTDGDVERTVSPPSGAAHVQLGGELRHPGSVTMDELRALPQSTVRAGFECANTGLRRYLFTGARLAEVLLAAGPRFDPVIGKDRVRFLAMVTGRDGHTAVVSWGELDPRYSDAGILLATSVDGRALDAEGPQLVVPGDTAGGRFVSRIVSIWAGPATALV